MVASWLEALWVMPQLLLRVVRRVVVPFEVPMDVEALPLTHLDVPVLHFP